MKKWVSGAVGVVVVAAASITGAAYWSGIRAQQWYEAALNIAADSENVKLTKERYERGLFSSQITTRVEISDAQDSNEPEVTFALRQQVYHGPLPFLLDASSPIALSGAVVRTTLDTNSSDWARKLGKWYGDQEPILAVSQISFAGASTTDLTMPPLTLNDTDDIQKLVFSGLHGQITVDAPGTALRSTWKIASLEVVDKPSNNADNQAAIAGAVVNLRDLRLQTDQHQGAFNLPIGAWILQLAELRAENPATSTTGQSFSANGLSISTGLEQQNPQQVSGTLRMAAEQITLDKKPGATSLNFLVRNLDGAALKKLQEMQTGNQSDSAELLNLLKTLLAGKPELLFDTQGKVGTDEWQGQLSLNFQPFDVAKANQALGGVLEKGTADVAASKSLVERLLVDQALETLQAQATAQAQTTDAATLRTQAVAQVNQQLQQIVSLGFLKLDGERYVSNARFADGKLLVNGQAVPLNAATAALGTQEDAQKSEETLITPPDDGAE